MHSREPKVGVFPYVFHPIASGTFLNCAHTQIDDTHIATGPTMHSKQLQSTSKGTQMTSLVFWVCWESVWLQDAWGNHGIRQFFGALIFSCLALRLKYPSPRHPIEQRSGTHVHQTKTLWNALCVLARSLQYEAWMALQASHQDLNTCWKVRVMLLRASASVDCYLCGA